MRYTFVILVLMMVVVVGTAVAEPPPTQPAGAPQPRRLLQKFSPSATTRIPPTPPAKPPLLGSTRTTPEHLPSPTSWADAPSRASGTGRSSAVPA